jgi:hypothetical protein
LTCVWTENTNREVARENKRKPPTLQKINFSFFPNECMYQYVFCLITQEFIKGVLM